MSEFFEDLPEDSNEEGNEKPEFVPDPATIAFLDQESAAFAEIADEFKEVYGFEHHCHCDEDYSAGRVGEVTECYAGMIVDSLATCAKLNHEKKQLMQMVSTLMEMNETLIEAHPENKESDGLENSTDGTEGVEFLDNPATGDGEAGA